MQHLYRSSPLSSHRLIFQEAASAGIESNETFRPSDMFMVGDSMTEGMAGTLPGVRSDAEQGRHVTEMAAAMDRAIAARPQPKVITIMGGTNDYSNQGLIAQEVAGLVAKARAAGIPVVVATLPNVHNIAMTEANQAIKGLAGEGVKVVDFASYPIGGDNIHFAGYGAPAREMFNAAQEISGFTDQQEMDVVQAILNGKIDELRGDTGTEIQLEDADVEAAAEAIAQIIPGSLDVADLMDRALEDVDELSELDDQSDLDALEAEIAEIVALEADLAEVSQLTAAEIEKMQAMTNLKLLEMPHNERLRYVTKNSVHADRVADGTVDMLTYTFTYDGQYNEGLWRDTTAGQTLPAEVRSVNVGGTTFSRAENSLLGEFFSEHGARLKIHEDTTLTDINTDPDVVTNVEAAIAEKREAFEGTDEEAMVAELAWKVGIDPAFVQAAFVSQEGNEIETEPDPDGAMVLTTAYKAKLRHFFTDIDRDRGLFNSQFDDVPTQDGDRLSPEFASFFLAETRDSGAVAEILRAVGSYTESEIIKGAVYVGKRKEIGSSGATNPENAAILNSGDINVVPEKQNLVNQAVEKALANKSKYESVSAKTGVPWELIAAIHYRESSFNFGTYLHNGQNLGQVTTIVPKGKLFHNWEDAAIDALKGGYGQANENDLLSQANFAERFNGMGYNNRGLNSPYVWAGHPRYENQGGMFVSDGNFSRTTKDGRVGVMPIIAVLRERQSKSNDVGGEVLK